MHKRSGGGGQQGLRVLRHLGVAHHSQVRRGRQAVVRQAVRTSSAAVILLVIWGGEVIIVNNLTFLPSFLRYADR